MWRIVSGRMYDRTSIVGVFLFSLLLVSLSVSSSDLSPEQESTMLELASNLSAIAPKSRWSSFDHDPCTWPGVGCSDGAVVNISFSGLGLTNAATNDSFVFPLICNLTSLETLDLSQNYFSSFPEPLNSTSCSMISGLKSLNFSSNVLAGGLPDLSALGALQLRMVDLSYNHFQESIDSQFDGLQSLKVLNLTSNNISGYVPTNLSTGLQALILSQNILAGQLTDSIYRYSNLTLLDLGQNLLNGPVPNGIENLSHLQILLLSSNKLDGEIPVNISKIQTLSRFAANQNGFGGSIPDGITDYLSSLDLSYNFLTGTIPPGLLSPPNLQSVDLTANKLGGPIPGNWSGSLYRLRLGDNQLNGSIPTAIGDPINLIYLELDDNYLTGLIPEQLDHCKNLTLLNLASNQLQGGLPQELGNLTKLVVLQLQENQLNGEIPEEIFELINLSTLNLSWNALIGGIPPIISRLQKISMLFLNDNQLNSSIPSSIANLSSLIELHLGSNKLSGTIPRMPTSLEMALNLSSNLFSGSIPSYIGDLDQLEILDLSDNKFTGDVPTSLTQMHGLTELLLSNNQLSGTLPVFPKWVIVNVTGNNIVSTSSTPLSYPLKKRSHILIIIISIVCSVVGFALLAALISFVVSRRLYRVEDGELEYGNSSIQIITGTVITSNSIHQSGIDFNKAMEAVSNPENIVMKTRFSTYYKATMPNGVGYLVKKLNWGEKAFHRGAHEKFGQELENLGRLSNSNVMVPLAYVLTGESVYLFYENLHKGTVFDFLHSSSGSILDWPSRYSIALGVAQGLTFLHGCTQPVLLLDLTTKSIHLKSPKEPQIGDIELLKVIDPSKSTGSLSTVAGSVGYIPPEYAYTMRLTMAGNVYSFGVILLELLTGKPPVSDGVELAKWAQSYTAWRDGALEALDPALRGTSPAVCSQMLSVMKIALSCVGASSEARPKMRNVLRMLFNAK